MKKHVPVSLLTFGAALLLPAAVLAHTGVGATTGFASGLAHPMVGVDHLLAMIAVGLWAAQIGGRAVWVLPGAFVGVMILGGMLGVSAVSVPHVEAGIAVSVLLLGLLIAAAFKFPLAVSAAIVAVFAVFHGHAHGTEMPVAVSAVSYGAGFAVATALLHAVGIAGATALRRLHIAAAVRATGTAIGLWGAYLLLAA